MSRSVTLLATLLAALLLAACGSLPAARSPPKLNAAGGDFTQTRLGRIASASLPAGSPSGFRLLPQSGQAFEAREQLIDQAARTIDAQYYFIANDASGRDFLEGLARAAGRGVQVRLLVDDMHTAAIDPALAALARLPNAEVRLFNPFCCARSSVVTRFAASALQLSRLDHRMHNKLLVADRSLAIAGGRNIADEYFARGSQYEFIDIDALMAGDIVLQLASIFTRYWNSAASWPAQDILGRMQPGEAAEAGPTGGTGATVPRPNLPPQDVLGQRPVGAELAEGRLQLVAGAAYAFADSPSKALHQDKNRDEDYLQETSVTTRARETILSAQSEVIISTPYLIPRTKGMAFLRHLHERDVRVQVLTNGVASNDSFFAHAGYSYYRHDMLKHGVELYELSATGVGAGERAGAGLRRWGLAARLHAKAFVIDQRTVFIGSMNLDPRSADKNTELGILVESTPLARQMLDVLEANRRLGAWRVKLDDATHSRLEWVIDGTGLPPRFLDAEPDAGLLDLLENLIYQALVPEALL